MSTKITTGELDYNDGKTLTIATIGGVTMQIWKILFDFLNTKIETKICSKSRTTDVAESESKTIDKRTEHDIGCPHCITTVIDLLLDINRSYKHWN